MDSTIAEYVREIERFSRVWVHLKRQLRTAKTEPERKLIRRSMYTVKVGKGQLARVVEYLQSHERLQTDGASEFDYDESRD